LCKKILIMLQFKSDKLIDYSHKLSKIHKSALPNAVRFTLTDAAKDVYFNTLQKHAYKEFDVKKASFFKTFSKYKPAEGWNINNMKATAGMVKGNKPKSVASTEIAKQQYAGTIPNKSYIASDSQRNSKGLLKPSYIRAISVKPIVFSGSNYYKKAIEAKTQNKPLLIKRNNKGVLVKVKRINKGGKEPIKTEILANYESNRSIKLKDVHPFVNNAALESGRKINSFYIKNAEKQIKRIR